MRTINRLLVDALSDLLGMYRGKQEIRHPPGMAQKMEKDDGSLTNERGRVRAVLYEMLQKES